MTEHDIQKSYFEWAEWQKIPELKQLFAVPNGGHRHPATAVKLKKEGVKPGVPDVLLPVARGAFIGMAIEFKANDGTPTKEQRERMTEFQHNGWCVTMCWDWQAAARFTLGYLGLTKFEMERNDG